MASALKSLFAVTLLILICLFGTWFYLRNTALSEPVKRPHDHPFLKSVFPALVAYPKVENSAFPDRQIDLDELMKLPESIIVWIPVTHDPAPDQPELFVRVSSGESKPLSEVLQALPRRRLVLSFLEHRPYTTERIFEVIDSAGAADRVLIHSPIDRLLKEIREKRPTWLYGTSHALSTRLKMMASIGLEAVVTITSDIVVIEQLPEKLSEFSPSVIADAHRRNLLVLGGPVDTVEEAKELFARKVDAVMISNPDALDSTLVESASQ